MYAYYQECVSQAHGSSRVLLLAILKQDVHWLLRSCSMLMYVLRYVITFYVLVYSTGGGSCGTNK
jgi:sugar phosphate permease